MVLINKKQGSLGKVFEALSKNMVGGPRKYTEERVADLGLFGGIYNITIEDYVSDAKQVLVNVFEGNRGKEVIMVAPTGSGKTYGIIDAIKGTDKQLTFAVPTLALVNQIKNDFKDVKNLKVTTYDSVNKVMKKGDILVVDEAHEKINSSDFRSKAINQLNIASRKAKVSVYVTATPRSLFYNKNINPNTILNFKHKEFVKQVKEIKVISNTSTYVNTTLELVLRHVNENGSILVELNSTKKLNELRDKLIESGVKGSEIEVLTAGNKDRSMVYNDIVTKSELNVKVLLTTELIRTGVNINTDVSTIITVGTGNVDNIAQFQARARKGVNVMYNIVSSTDHGSKYDIDVEELVEEAVKVSENELSKAKGLVEAYNAFKDQLTDFNKGKEDKETKEILESVLTDNLALSNINYDGEDVYIAHEEIINEALVSEERHLLTNHDLFVQRLTEAYPGTPVELYDGVKFDKTDTKVIEKVDTKIESERKAKTKQDKIDDTIKSLKSDDLINKALTDEQITELATRLPSNRTKKKVNRALSYLATLNTIGAIGDRSKFKPLFALEEFFSDKDRITPDDIQEFLDSGLSFHKNSRTVVNDLRTIFKMKKVKTTNKDRKSIIVYDIEGLFESVEDIVKNIE